MVLSPVTRVLATAMVAACTTEGSMEDDSAEVGTDPPATMVVEAAEPLRSTLVKNMICARLGGSTPCSAIEFTVTRQEVSTAYFLQNGTPLGMALEVAVRTPDDETFVATVERQYDRATRTLGWIVDKVTGTSEKAQLTAYMQQIYDLMIEDRGYPSPPDYPDLFGAMAAGQGPSWLQQAIEVAGYGDHDGAGFQVLRQGAVVGYLVTSKASTLAEDSLELRSTFYDGAGTPLYTDTFAD